MEMESEMINPSELKLQNRWTLWHYCQPEKTKDWQNTILKPLWSGIGTVGQLCTLCRLLPKPSEIKKGNGFAIFKDGITPTWEDESNQGGGRWTIVVCSSPNDKQQTWLSDADTLWLDTILAITGEQIDCDFVCGCFLDVRDGFDRIAIWIGAFQNELQSKAIAQSWNLSLSKTKSPHLLCFQPHGENISKKKGKKKKPIQ